jgi:hypothetical protein
LPKSPELFWIAIIAKIAGIAKIRNPESTQPASRLLVDYRQEGTLAIRVEFLDCKISSLQSATGKSAPWGGPGFANCQLLFANC